MEKRDKTFGHLSCQLSISAKCTISKEVAEAVTIVSVAESNIKSCKRHLNDTKGQVKSKLSECASVQVQGKKNIENCIQSQVCRT